MFYKYSVAHHKILHIVQFKPTFSVFRMFSQRSFFLVNHRIGKITFTALSYLAQ